MPTHWTYADFDPDDDLFQGDIIAHEPLLDLLSSVHRHFCDRKYLGFVVVTQTCDLVLRGTGVRSCKTKHINLAAIRSLGSLLPNFLQELCDSPAPGVFTQESRAQAEAFLRKVINQNELANGIFYLHKDGDVGIAEPAVALLRVSIALRAQDHYELVKSSRRGRLDTEYRNKLGWIAGYLYSRVDTTDWDEHNNGKEGAICLIREMLEGAPDAPQNVWVQEAWVQAARRKKVDLSKVPLDQVMSVLQSHAPKPAKEVALEQIRLVGQRLWAEFHMGHKEKFHRRLAEDAALMPLVREKIRAILHETLGHLAADPLAHLVDVLCADAILREHIVACIMGLAEQHWKAPGPKDLPRFVGAVQASPIFSPEAITRFNAVANEELGTVFSEWSQSVNQMLATATSPSYLVDHFRALAQEVMGEGLIDMLIKRLGNNQQFNTSLR